MPDLLLDGSFATPTCLQLALIAYFKVFGLIIVFVAIWTAVVCLNGLTAPGGFRWNLEAMKADPTVRPILVVSGIAALAAIATISLTGPLSHLRIRMIATDSAFIETGCYIGARYVEPSTVKTRLSHLSCTAAKCFGSSRRGQRWLYVPIESNPNFRNLVMIAPTAMREYWGYLTSEK